jgi:hypothetical protein
VGLSIDKGPRGSKLRHPNVVHFIGACMEAPNLCFVMELCSMSLYDLLHRRNDPIKLSSLVTMAVSRVSVNGASFKIVMTDGYRVGYEILAHSIPCDYPSVKMKLF